MARKSIHDPDAELDATAIVRNMLQGEPEPSAPAQPRWTPPETGQRRERRSKGRPYGPDSLPGLADYFTNSCPPLSWAGGLEIGNRQALVAVFSELRRESGLSPDDCRALVDLYVTRLAGKAPARPYVWDFKWRRFQLLRDLRSTGLTVTAEEYSTWQEAPRSDAPTDDNFTASWGSST
ncbi:hypothetical protein [Actinacidiphila sp. ITFR-21]|uniref:hypothetical protein n=1 Tax=Actinacidiphila sp. ITFR-21 TaxID=3075199 RepID=UPI00288A1783|nr:hypothetical protein [Streptomyces sp. ITFR-21]WNI17604.1 hypothetical protein RLT57_20155 [Streptomyces sp. ITFR-21]WNI17744.1 hypothetical protein RLT57_20870 [Streptomyces sp. ITFR-21]